MYTRLASPGASGDPPASAPSVPMVAPGIADAPMTVVYFAWDPGISCSTASALTHRAIAPASSLFILKQ